MKIITVVLAITVMVFGFINYQQGNEIARLSTANTELKSKLYELTKYEIPSAKKRALANQFADAFTEERPPVTMLHYSDSFDDIPDTNKNKKPEEQHERFE